MNHHDLRRPGLHALWLQDFLSQDQYAFDHVRVSDALIMGNRRLWRALEEREILYTKTD
jgi:hypothetical protein